MVHTANSAHLVDGGERGAAGLKLVADRHVRRHSQSAPRPVRTFSSPRFVYAARISDASEVSWLIVECYRGRRDGYRPRNADGGRAAGRARGAAGAGLAAGAEGHHLDQAVRRRAPVPHHGQEPPGALRGVRRHRGGRRHHRPTDQQEQRIRICELSMFI